MFSSGLYAIADADHTPDVVTWGETLLRGGVRTLQLRAKTWSRVTNSRRRPPACEQPTCTMPCSS